MRRNQAQSEKYHKKPARGISSCNLNAPRQYEKGHRLLAEISPAHAGIGLEIRGRCGWYRIAPGRHAVIEGGAFFTHTKFGY